MDSIAVYNGRDLVGDGILKLPFVRALRAAYPGHRIVWLTSGESAFRTSLRPLVEGLIDEVTVRPDLLRSKWEVLRPSRIEERFDVVIDTQTSLWRALALRRIPHGLFVSSAARFLCSERRPAWPFDKPRNVVRRLLLLLELAAGRPAELGSTRIAVPEDVAAKAAGVLPAGPSYLGLAPGAGRRVKCWPLERFIEVAKWQAERGGVPVFLIGPDEQEWLAEVRDAVPEALFPLQESAITDGGFSPIKTIALAARLSAALSNDSGVGHMLAAADIPLLTLFGPTSPEKFQPIISRGAVLSAQGFGGGEAMDAIPVEAVTGQLTALLAS